MSEKCFYRARIKETAKRETGEDFFTGKYRTYFSRLKSGIQLLEVRL